MSTHILESGQPSPAETFLVDSPSLRGILERAKQIAKQRGTILVEGPSGTGKTHITKVLHQYSDRSDKPLLVRRCEGMTAQVLDGAICHKADGGTLILDDIDLMGASAQGRLVRYFDEQTLDRLGDRGGVKAPDVRVILTTSKNLDLLVREGKFLADLWYRLRRWRIVMPKLKGRAKDIRILANRFLSDFMERNGELVTEKPWSFSEEVLYLFTSMPWPGNVRELRDVVENIALFAQGDKTPIQLKQAADVLYDPVYFVHSYEQDAPDNQKKRLHYVLESTGWNASLTARILGISRGDITKAIQEQGWVHP